MSASVKRRARARAKNAPYRVFCANCQRRCASRRHRAARCGLGRGSRCGGRRSDDGHIVNHRRSLWHRHRVIGRLVERRRDNTRPTKSPFTVAATAAVATAAVATAVAATAAVVTVVAVVITAIIVAFTLRPPCPSLCRSTSRNESSAESRENALFARRNSSDLCAAVLASPRTKRTRPRLDGLQHVTKRILLSDYRRQLTSSPLRSAIDFGLITLKTSRFRSSRYFFSSSRAIAFAAFFSRKLFMRLPRPGDDSKMRCESIF